MLKTGVTMYSFPPEADFSEALDVIASTGYHAVEPVIEEDGFLTFAGFSSRSAEAVRMTKERGLEISGLGIRGQGKHNLVSDSPTERGKAADMIRRAADAAAIMGTDTVLVSPGTVTPEIRYDAAYERSQEQLSRLAVYAGERGVRLGIENLWNRFLLSPLEMRRFVDEIGSESLGVYFDVGNILAFGYPEQWIPILENRILRIHICDYRISSGGMVGFTDLFAGDVDFEKTASAIASVGYSSYLTLEIFPGYRKFPELAVISNKVKLDRIVSMCEEQKERYEREH